VDVLAPPVVWRCQVDGRADRVDRRYTFAAVSGVFGRTQSACHSQSALVRNFTLVGLTLRRIVRPKSEGYSPHRWIADTFPRGRLSGRSICERLGLPVAHGSRVVAPSRIEGRRNKTARDCGSFAQFSGGVLPFLDHSTKIKTNKARERHRHAAFMQKEKSP
jgi:hypothetical protein